MCWDNIGKDVNVKGGPNGNSQQIKAPTSRERHSLQCRRFVVQTGLKRKLVFVAVASTWAIVDQGKCSNWAESRFPHWLDNAPDFGIRSTGSSWIDGSTTAPGMPKLGRAPTAWQPISYQQRDKIFYAKLEKLSPGPGPRGAAAQDLERLGRRSTGQDLERILSSHHTTMPGLNFFCVCACDQCLQPA